MYMTPKQCRMARAALQWTTVDLANAASVNPTTVNNFENGKDTYASTISKLRKAIESSDEIRFDGDRCVCTSD